MFNIVPFISYVFVVSFTPGPNNIMSMATASKFGYKKTLNFILGVSTGFSLLMIICSYFNLFLFNIIPKIKTFMGFLGAFYMIYLALKIMKSNTQKKDDENESSQNSEISNLNLFITGTTMQFINPKAILYGITVVSNFIIPFYKTGFSLLLFSLFLGFIAFLSTSSWAIFGSLFSMFLSKYQKQFNILMGLLLIYSAISISGITQLF